MDDIILNMEPEQALKELSRMNDPDCALLYACAYSSGGYLKSADAAVMTGMDARRLERAWSTLIYNKLWRIAGVHVEERTAYSPAEIIAAQKRDPRFRDVCDYAEQIFKKSLHKSEYEALYRAYGELNTPPEIIMLMVNYCREAGRLSARSLEKTAYDWHDRGIRSYDVAAALVEEMKEKNDRYGRVLSLFGIRGRAPSESEARYIDAWLAMDMRDELLRLAYDRTVLRTGKLQWRYMHRILEDWHKKGYRTRKQVEMMEGAVESAAPTPEKAPEESVEDAVRRRFAERLRRREEESERFLRELREKSPAFAENEIALRRLTVSKAKASLTQQPPEAFARQQAELLAQRGAILRSLGLDESALEPRFDCPLCRDRGSTADGVCECFRRACAEEEQRRLRLNI